MSIELVNKTTDDATPPWTTFTFKMPGGNAQANDVLNKLRRAVPAAYMANTTVQDGQLILTAIKVRLIREHLNRKQDLDLQEIAALMR